MQHGTYQYVSYQSSMPSIAVRKESITYCMGNYFGTLGGNCDMYILSGLQAKPIPETIVELNTAAAPPRTGVEVL